MFEREISEAEISNILKANAEENPGTQWTEHDIIFCIKETHRRAFDMHREILFEVEAGEDL